MQSLSYDRTAAVGSDKFKSMVGWWLCKCTLITMKATVYVSSRGASWQRLRVWARIRVHSVSPRLSHGTTVLTLL
jgi:hypothetical protein